MPHKINPINFENSEGITSKLFIKFMSEKLLYHDYKGLTIQLCYKCWFNCYIIVALKNFKKGFNKLDIKNKIKNDLNDNCVVIIEGIQTILRKYGIDNAYELCKDLTRNNESITKNNITFYKILNIDEDIKKII